MGRALRRHPLAPFVAALLVSTFLLPAAAERGRARSGWLEVVSSTNGAEVFVDGERVGEVPLEGTVPLEVGEHSVKISKRGYTEHLEVVRVRARKGTTLEADLLAISGMLRVSASVEGARVFVDGNYVGDVPVDQDVEPGERSVRVTKLGYYDFVTRVNVAAGEPAELSVELEALPPEQNPTYVPPPRPRRWYEHWWLWTAVGAGVAAIAIGLAVGLTVEPEDPCSQEVGWDCDDAITFRIGD